MLRLLVFFSLIITGSAYAHGPGTSNDFKGRRVLIIGIDGARPDAIQALMNTESGANLKGLVDSGAVSWNTFAGGELGGATEQITSSGPGWSTILTGVWRNKHRVKDNKFRGNRLASYPYFMRRLKEVKPTAWCASLVDWPEIHQFIADDSRIEGREFLDHKLTLSGDTKVPEKRWDVTDAKIAEAAIEHLKQANPDCMFVYFGQVDETGHGAHDSAGRFDPQNEPYMKALARVDSLIGNILSAVKARPEYAAEDWLILLTTDHGGNGKSHGGQSEQERKIWLIASGKNAESTKLPAGPMGHSAIPHLAFRHLGLTPDPAWDWEPLSE